MPNKINPHVDTQLTDLGVEPSDVGWHDVALLIIAYGRRFDEPTEEPPK